MIGQVIETICVNMSRMRCIYEMKENVNRQQILVFIEMVDFKTSIKKKKIVFLKVILS